MSLARHDISWHAAAACTGQPGDWWFPDRAPGGGEWAKAICRGCPVRHECLAFAASGNEDHGIWGGFTTREIDAFKRARCRVCLARIPPAEVATLAIGGVDPSRWACRACWYREIADRRRT